MDFGQGLGRYCLAERSKLAKLRGENSGPEDPHRSPAATTLRGLESIVPGMAGSGGRGGERFTIKGLRGEDSFWFPQEPRANPYTNHQADLAVMPTPFVIGPRRLRPLSAAR